MFSLAPIYLQASPSPDNCIQYEVDDRDKLHESLYTQAVVVLKKYDFRKVAQILDDRR